MQKKISPHPDAHRAWFWLVSDWESINTNLENEIHQDQMVGIARGNQGIKGRVRHQ